MSTKVQPQDLQGGSNAPGNNKVYGTDGTGTFGFQEGAVSATETTEGLVERATDAEASAGTDTTRYITPKQLKDNGGGKSFGPYSLVYNQPSPGSYQDNTLATEDRYYTAIVDHVNTGQGISIDVGGVTIYNDFRPASGSGTSISATILIPKGTNALNINFNGGGTNGKVYRSRKNV